MADVVTDHDPLGAAAQLVGEAIGQTLARAKDCRFAIPGGSAAKVLGPLRGHVSDQAWSRVLLTWVDERLVPLDDPESNRGTAYRLGLLDNARRAAFELPLHFDGEPPKASVERVLDRLRFPFGLRLDVVLLGMGEDGHVASIFPGHPSMDEIGGCSLVHDSPKPPPLRITLTRDLLRTAQRTVLVATGEGKRAALQRLVSGDGALPASDLPHLTIVTDLAL